MTDDIDDNDNVKPFVKVGDRVKTSVPRSNDKGSSVELTILPDHEDKSEYIKMAFESFKEKIEESPTGFMAIIFDKEDKPHFIWAGEADMIAWIGALEIFKTEFLKSLDE